MTWGFQLKQRPHPDHETWKPKLIRGDGPEETVPERLRGVRLLRKRTAKMPPTPEIVRIGIFLAIVGFVLVVFRTLLIPR